MTRSSDDRLRWYQEGYCDSEIAERLGIRTSSISQWRKNHGLPDAFQNRKRLTEWEKKKIQDALLYCRKYSRSPSPGKLRKLEKGLTSFVMSLKHALARVSQEDVENYIIQHNAVDLSRRDELLKTDAVTRFRVPNVTMRELYGFVASILAVRIFYRDKGCTVCKSIHPLHLHHMKGKFNLLEENLTTLCENCHLSIRHAARQYPGEE